MTATYIRRYVVSKEFTKYINDWIVVVLLALEVALIGERTKPFLREFAINDPTLQHPYAEHERVTAVQCLLISSLVPIFTIAATLLLFHGRNFDGRRSNSNNSNTHLSTTNNNGTSGLNVGKLGHHLHLLNISFLGLFLSLTLNGAITDLLKNWISRPRPDFIARCGPKFPPKFNHSSEMQNYNLSICTAPMGEAVLLEGLRSCPSGHSSNAFSGLLYLSLWLAGQLKAFKPQMPVWRLLVALVPTFMAIYIAVSRTQDYRHHFGDILLGGSLGSVIAAVLYFKFFHSIFDFKKCHLPYDNGEESENDSDSSYLPL